MTFQLNTIRYCGSILERNVIMAGRENYTSLLTTLYRYIFSESIEIFSYHVWNVFLNKIWWYGTIIVSIYQSVCEFQVCNVNFKVPYNYNITQGQMFRKLMIRFLTAFPCK